MGITRVLREGALAAALAVSGCCGLPTKVEVPRLPVKVSSPVLPKNIARVDVKNLTIPERRAYDSTTNYYRGIFSDYVDYMTGVTPGGANSRELKENITRLGRERLILNYRTINQMSFDLAMQRYKEGKEVTEKDIDELAGKVVEFTTNNFARVYTNPRHPLVMKGHRNITEVNSKFFRTFIERAVKNQSGPLVLVAPAPQGDELIRATFTEEEYRKHTERLADAFGTLYKGFEASVREYDPSKSDALLVRNIGPTMARNEGAATQRFYKSLVSRVYPAKKPGVKK